MSEEYTEGVNGYGAVVLIDGVEMSVYEVISKLNELSMKKTQLRERVERLEKVADEAIELLAVTMPDIYGLVTDPAYVDDLEKALEELNDLDK